MKYYLIKLKYLYFMLMGDDDRAGEVYINNRVLLCIVNILKHHGATDTEHHHIMELIGRTYHNRSSFNKYHHLYMDVYHLGDILSLMYYHGDLSIEEYNVVLDPTLPLYNEINIFATSDGSDPIDFTKAIRKS